MSVCAIIPAYNEAKTIGKVVQEARKYVDTVFVIDDGSSDETAKFARDSGAKVILHGTNLGIGKALHSGYTAAMNSCYEYIVQLDSDGQHDPKYIPAMLETAKQYDIVIGSRFLNGCYRNYSFTRRLGISFFTQVVNILGHLHISDVTSGYRVYRTDSLKRLTPVTDRHWAVGQTLEAGKKGLRVSEVSVEMPVRRTGRSHFSLLRFALYPLKMMWVVTKVMLFR